MAIAIVLMPISVAAQQAPGRRIELGGNVHWSTATTFGDVYATESAFGGATRTVFRTSTTVAQVVSPEGRIGIGLTRFLDAEGAIAFGRTHLTTRITADPEAADATLAEPLTQYLVEGGVAAHLARWRKGHGVPFVSAGVGYIRQLHDGHTLVEGGRTFHAGAGFRYEKNEAARGLRSAGLRVELRATILTGGLTIDGGSHVSPTVIAGVFFHI